MTQTYKLFNLSYLIAIFAFCLAIYSNNKYLLADLYVHYIKDISRR